MYNEDDTIEVSDFDEDIEMRKAILAEAKAIPCDAKWSEVGKQITDLRRKWKRIAFWDSAYEESMSEEFDYTLDVFYERRKEDMKQIEDVKKDLIKQAQEVCEEENINQASKKMDELMMEWKCSGAMGKEKDDALWEEFNCVRQTFYDRKHQYWEDRKDQFAKAKEGKEALILKAQELKDSTDWQKGSEAFNDLMKQWKALGSAGRDHEDALWNRFNENRQVFYANREVHYEEMRTTYQEHYDAKRALIEQAKEIIEKQTFTSDTTNKMKNLGVEWKKIGTCGKGKEDKVWKEFRNIMDEYFDGLKENNQQKHLDWIKRMQETRGRKVDLLQKQKKQIQYMQNEIVGLIGERAIQEMEEEIEEKKEFVKTLEEELKELDQTMEKQ